jgi:putative tryptophan/tyrosine transport system substrate-binding protein
VAARYRRCDPPTQPGHRLLLNGTLLSGATAWVAAARAQEPRRLIGVLGSASYGAFPGAETAFIQGLKATGFFEGKNIEWRWAEGQYNRLSLLAGELLSRNVAMIVTWDAPASLAAKAATRTTPIVFFTGTDPVEIGLVQSFSRPSGNLTGIYVLVADVGPKHLELLHELLPTASMIASLLNPGNPNAHPYALQTQAAADALGLRLQALTAHTEADLEAAFGIMVQQRVDALLVIADPFFIIQRKQVVALAAGHGIPTIYPVRWFTECGGLMSYGAAFGSLYQQLGTYAGRILKGVKVIDLPIEHNIRYELVINLKTAKALGLTVPPSLLARTDQVIE